MKKLSLSQLSPLALVPCLLSVSSAASAAIVCSPSATPSAGIVALRGNCIETNTNEQLSAGAEIWHVRSTVSDLPLGQRAIPNGSLDVQAPTLPGEYTYYISGIDQGYGGLINLGGEGDGPGVTITVASDCAITTPPAPPPVTPVAAGAVRTRSSVKKKSAAGEPGCPGDASLTQLVTPLMALQAQRMRSNLDQAQNRLRTLRSTRSTALLDVQGVPLPEKLSPGQGPTAQRLGFYINGLGDYLRQNSVADQPEFKLRTTAVSIGADYRLGDDWVLGGNIGGAKGDVKFSSSQSKQTNKGTQATAYASWNLPSLSYLSASLSYEANKFNLTRDDGSGELALSAPRGHGLGFSLSGGRDFVMGAWSVGPYVRWDNITTQVEAFEEAGSASAVAMGEQRVQSNLLNIGAQTQISIPVSWGIVLPYVRLEYTYRKDSAQSSPTARLLNGNTALLIPTSADIQDQYGNVAVGVSGLNQGGFGWFIDYESGLAQNGYRTQRLGLGLRFEL